MIETETVGFERSVSNTFQRIHSLPIFFLICFRRTARRKTCCSSVYPRCASSLRKSRAGISANPVFPTSRLRPESVCRRSEQYPYNFRSRHMPSTFRRNFSFCLFVYSVFMKQNGSFCLLHIIFLRDSHTSSFSRILYAYRLMAVLSCLQSFSCFTH